MPQASQLLALKHKTLLRTCMAAACHTLGMLWTLHIPSHAAESAGPLLVPIYLHYQVAAAHANQLLTKVLKLCIIRL